MTADERMREAVAERLYNTLGKAIQSASKHDIYMAPVAGHPRPAERPLAAYDRGALQRQPEVRLLSLRRVHDGQANSQNLLYTNMTGWSPQLAEIGTSLQEMIDLEPEPGLGNGGLGRLAACFMDSLATLDLPAVGCNPLRVRHLPPDVR